MNIQQTAWQVFILFYMFPCESEPVYACAQLVDLGSLIICGFCGKWKIKDLPHSFIFSTVKRAEKSRKVTLTMKKFRPLLGKENFIPVVLCNYGFPYAKLFYILLNITFFSFYQSSLNKWSRQSSGTLSCWITVACPYWTKELQWVNITNNYISYTVPLSRPKVA